MRRALDLAGKRYGRLIAIESVGINHRGLKRWRCACDCGNETIAVGRDLPRGHTKSCGCLHATQLGASLIRHGQARSTGATSEYRSWCAMRSRCRNSKTKDFKHYGGRGIVVCERWNSFESFFADMGRKPTPKHTIERDDTNGNYEPDNCRWATQAEQVRNRRECQPPPRGADGKFCGQQ